MAKKNATTTSRKSTLVRRKKVNTAALDNFGYAAAVSSDGSTLAVGAVTQGGSGAAYIFVRTGPSWSQQTMLKASNADLGDTFGDAVALSDDGSTLVVGALGEDSAATGVGGDQADNTASFAGAVYVFRRTGGPRWFRTDARDLR